MDKEDFHEMLMEAEGGPKRKTNDYADFSREDKNEDYASEEEMRKEEKALGNAPSVRDRNPSSEMDTLNKIYDPADLNNRGFKGKAARAMKEKMDRLAKK